MDQKGLQPLSILASVHQGSILAGALRVIQVVTLISGENMHVVVPDVLIACWLVMLTRRDTVTLIGSLKCDITHTLGKGENEK